MYMWNGARDFANGNFYEPRYYGQDYNTYMEALFAVPFMLIGFPVAFSLMAAGLFFAGIAMSEGFFGMAFLSLLGLLDDRFVILDRKASRDYNFQKIIKHMNKDGYYNKRLIIFPEGTRLKHMYLSSKEESKSLLKPGLLKSIYEYNKLYLNGSRVIIYKL